jgi:hypothetical protein
MGWLFGDYMSTNVHSGGGSTEKTYEAIRIRQARLRRAVEESKERVRISRIELKKSIGNMKKSWKELLYYICGYTKIFVFVIKHKKLKRR